MDDQDDQKNQVSRRQALKIGATAAGVALLSGMGIWKWKGQAYGGDTPSLEHFKDPLPIPKTAIATSPGQNPQYTISMQQFQHEIHSAIGRRTTVWGYGDHVNGASWPGPTFQTRQGQNVTVNWVNNLSGNPNAPHYLKIDPNTLNGGIHGATNDRKTVVHLHGGHIRANVDGYPEDTFLPGDSATYLYELDQANATLVYHDHSLGNTRLNVMMGLFGVWVHTDSTEAALRASSKLPTPAFEIPLIIQDRRIKENGQLGYDQAFDDTFFGDVAVVNGKAWPYLEVQRRKYRFRIGNASNTRAYTLKLEGGGRMVQIGSDGGLLRSPVVLTELTLVGGERADVVIDFAQYGDGDDVVLRNTHPGHDRDQALPELMQFRIRGPMVSDGVVLPDTLQTIVPLNPAGATQRRLVLEDEFDPTVGNAEHTINGKMWDDIEEYIPNGSIEVWNFVNKTSMIHPMHIHLVQFQVLSRVDAKGKNLGVNENEKGWKDTVRVGPKETVKVIAMFKGQGSPGDAPERFAYHCHLLEHEDHEMMRQYELVY